MSDQALVLLSECVRLACVELLLLEPSLRGFSILPDQTEALGLYAQEEWVVRHLLQARPGLEIRRYRISRRVAESVYDWLLGLRFLWRGSDRGLVILPCWG